MLERGRGRIVFITSISAYTASVNRAEYCISKAGLSMSAAIYAQRLAAHGIQVFEIRPGIIRTDMTAPAEKTYAARIAAGLLPQPRMGEGRRCGARGAGHRRRVAGLFDRPGDRRRRRLPSAQFVRGL